jgi:hypothetical protein
MASNFGSNRSVPVGWDSCVFSEKGVPLEVSRIASFRVVGRRYTRTITKRVKSSRFDYKGNIYVTTY